MPQRRKLLFAALLGLAASCPAIAENLRSPDAAPEPWPSALLQISSTEAFSKHAIVVDKKERKLMIFERDGERIRKKEEIPADIGKNDGDKLRENDHRTPEGIYFFQKKLAPPEIPFSLYGKMAFTTDYPNLFDRRARKTGSGIWLHSIPDTVPLTRGSRGCVVIRNEALERVENLIELKQTPIIIENSVEYLTREEHDQRRREMNRWIDSWKSAWESKKIEDYLSFYDPGFSAKGFADLSAWGRHKAKIFKTYKNIKVSISQPFLLLHKDQLLIKTLQKFESEAYTDYGVKTIHAVKSPEGYRIVSEEWEKADEKGLTTLFSELQSSGLHPQY